MADTPPTIAQLSSDFQRLYSALVLSEVSNHPAVLTTKPIPTVLLELKSLLKYHVHLYQDLITSMAVTNKKVSDLKEMMRLLEDMHQ